MILNGIYLVQNLSFVYAHLWDDVITNVNNWQQFSVIVQFYETFARDALTSKNKHNDYSLSSFYLNQYKVKFYIRTLKNEIILRNKMYPFTFTLIFTVLCFV